MDLPRPVGRARYTANMRHQQDNLQHMGAADTFEFSGILSISTRKYKVNATWPFADCVISSESIIVHVLWYEAVHLRSSIVELRWVKRLFPYAIVVSRNADGSHQYSTLQMLRWSRLKAALERFGYKFTSHGHRQTKPAASDDELRYGLSDRTGPDG